jgi:hypothetical protein
MSGSVTFVVELDAAGAPPAADSVRQLLVLLDSLQAENSDLDWRLLSVTLNSPLRAEVAAFDREGREAPDQEALKVADMAFEVLNALNDNGPAKATGALDESEKKRLKTLLSPMKDRSGRVQIHIPGRPDRVVRSDNAKRLLVAISAPAKRRAPELGSIEGYILSAAKHYGDPALRVMSKLSSDEVLCVFSPSLAAKIGGSHTLEEVWRGRRVVVTGKVTFGADGAPTTVHATDLRSLPDVKPPELQAALLTRLSIDPDGWSSAH